MNVAREKEQTNLIGNEGPSFKRKPTRDITVPIRR